MKSNPEVCGGGGKGKPLHQFNHLINMLDRQEAVRKAKEQQAMMAALARYVLDTPTPPFQGMS
jgi:hypothetical protein